MGIGTRFDISQRTRRGRIAVFSDWCGETVNSLAAETLAALAGNCPTANCQKVVTQAISLPHSGTGPSPDVSIGRNGRSPGCSRPHDRG